MYSCSLSACWFHLSNPLLSVEWRVWFRRIHTSVRPCNADTSSQPADFGYRGPALHSAYPHLLLPRSLSFSLLCDTLPIFKERKIDQEWKPGLEGEGERDCKWQRGEEWERASGRRNKKRKETLLANLCYRCASSFHCCSLSVKKDILTAFLSISFFSLIFFCGNHMLWLLPFTSYLIDCAHHLKEWDMRLWWIKTMPISSELNNYVCPISKQI